MGEWVELTFTFIVDDENEEKKEVQLNVKAFVSYQQTPEPGLAGFLALSRSRYNYDTNILAQLSEQFTSIQILNY